jgi:hypothetical protein
MTENNELLKYEVPQVITYTDEEILEELGPAQTFYGDATKIDGF